MLQITGVGCAKHKRNPHLQSGDDNSDTVITLRAAEPSQ
jgi:hypothetical protein